MTLRIYPKFNGPDEDRGFTAEEIRKGIWALYADYECPECDRVQPVTAGQICKRCGYSFN